MSTTDVLTPHQLLRNILASKRSLLAFVLVFAAVISYANSAVGHDSLALSPDESALPQKEANPRQVNNLKTHFNKQFLVGSAINAQQAKQTQTDTDALIIAQFNSITPENEMKWERIHPKPEVYDFTLGDEYVDYGQANNMFTIGHTLVWHSQTPDWVFEDAQGKPLSREALLARMKEHIHTVVGRYKGKIKGWDIVNEALNEDGSLRDSKWREIIGDDYIEKAFTYAHAADPKAELYYNDYNMYKPEKSAGAARLIKSLQSKGIPVHGVGLQGHYSLTHPDLRELDEALNLFASLGIKSMITELDVSVLPFPNEAEQGADINQDLALQKTLNPYPDGLPEDKQVALSKRYKDIFTVLISHQASLSRVTFWGVNDANSWRNNWPMQGRTDYPLLFDRENKPKLAYQVLMDL
ncbi:Endo-1,4-beta-xylanase A [Paraglaciecola mesophila]|uniref:Beta-xylanase n=1 Tax=Paraglaciecola mesophila TaxID=197222 RepID=A0A857JQ00_9ALTE|nr:endo-1,4-beta-xylanase [Paraglaciecola mesophila]QHJ13933.1 Endo-1,4-beta-xylanase A [Paraglaciecola mesophila]